MNQMEDELPSKYSVAAKTEQRLKAHEAKKQMQSNKAQNTNTYETNRLKRTDSHQMDDDDEEGV